jgi:hypothetical protein
LGAFGSKPWREFSVCLHAEARLPLRGQIQR